MYLAQGIEAINVIERGRSPGYEAWIAVGLVSVSSLAGAWLARRNSARVVVWLAIASATMLVIAMTDLLPDAWREASETGVPWWAIAVAAAVGFLVITYFTRKGCGCEADSDKTAGRHAPGRHRRLKQAVDTALFSGMGTAAALTTHRAIEGATLALTASVVVVVALMVHSASEGLALAALLDMAKQRLAPWLVVACVAPAVGVLAATIHPIPGKVVPILLSIISGVLTRTAVVGLKLAASKQAGGRLSRRQVTIAGLGAITVGALIVVAHTSENAGPARTRTQPVHLAPSPARSVPRTRPRGAPRRGRPTDRPTDRPTAMRLAARPARGGFTYGLKRAEILSPQLNVVTLLVLGALFCYEAIARLIESPEVEGRWVLTTALTTGGHDDGVRAGGRRRDAGGGDAHAEGGLGSHPRDRPDFSPGRSERAGAG
ncbi:cation transporter [Actinoallomurus oryzae]|uniref:cation transporter n=1 Tax=Actinoallomurus oryzae TaxID=502180 RepID=UPI0031EDE679